MAAEWRNTHYVVRSDERKKIRHTTIWHTSKSHHLRQDKYNFLPRSHIFTAAEPKPRNAMEQELNRKQLYIYEEMTNVLDTSASILFITTIKRVVKDGDYLLPDVAESCERPSEIIEKLKDHGKIKLLKNDINLKVFTKILGLMKEPQLKMRIEGFEKEMKDAAMAESDVFVELPSYETRSDPRGLCIIINNVNFEPMPCRRQLEDRNGSDIDKANLYNIFSKLKFVVDVQKNLKGQAIVDVAKRAANMSDHAKYDCFAFCILSHGAKGEVYGTDGQGVEISTITQHFRGVNCPNLRGKPKLFFIQACQGNTKQVGFETDSTDEGIQPALLPNESDFLFGYATLPGYVCFRSETDGSLYISKLVKMLDKYSDRHDLLSIMIKVNEEVAAANALTEDGIHKQMPMVQATLRKKVFLRK